jgi:anthranilate synthase component 1
VSEYFPSSGEFERLSRSATVVPVYREVIADRLTPVLAHATLGQDAGSYLLESVVGGEKWARYSFVGFAPEVIVRGVADRFERIVDGKVEQELGVDPWERLRETLAEWKPPTRCGPSSRRLANRSRAMTTGSSRSQSVAPP